VLLANPVSTSGMTPIASNSDEFIQRKGATSTSGVYNQNYGYQGSAKKTTETVDSRTYVTRYHITDTLPLTAIDVVKTWDDQSDIFKLRPNDISDNLTLSHKSANDTFANISSQTFTALDSTNRGEYQTASATFPVKNSTNNTYTYTYIKVLKYAENNDPYVFKVEETRSKAYLDPEFTDREGKTYTTQYLNYDDVDRNDYTTTGVKALSTTLAVTNELDTRDITVYKKWDDGGNTDTRYTVDFTLNSTYVRKDTNNNPVNENYTQTKPADETPATATDEYDTYAVFTALPKYDADGNVIVYNVSENVHEGTDTLKTGVFTIPAESISNVTATITLCGLYKTKYYKVINAVTGDALCTISHDTETGTRDVYVSFTVPSGQFFVKVQESSDGTNYTDLKDVKIKVAKKTQDGNVILDDVPYFIDGQTKYGYAGSATYVAESETINSVEKKYVTEYYVTNKLPLTYMKTEKVWDNKTPDNLNKYSDSYMAVSLDRKTNSGANYATVIPNPDNLPLTFTLEVSSNNGTTYEPVSDNTIVAKINVSGKYNHDDSGVFTIPYTEKSDGKYVIFINNLDENKKYRITNISGCSEYEIKFTKSIVLGDTMKITASGDPAVIIDHSENMYKEFDSLPVYDESNNAYSYKIVEKPLKGYTESYSTSTGESRTYSATDNIVTAQVKDSNNPQMVYIKNTQILGNAEVKKIDQNHYDAFNDHSAGYVDEVIPNATFELTCNGIDVNVMKDTDEKYILGGDSNIVISDAQGMIYFKDFPLNTYTLTESKKLPNYLLREQPAVFTIDVENASATTAKASYDSGFVLGSEPYNRIGNLQHVEQTKITLVKVDEEDEAKRLPGATYYLLQMVPYNSTMLMTETEYLAAADKAITDCNFEITKEDGRLKSSVALFWHTSDMVSGSHIPSVYTTNANGEIEAPQYMLAKPAGDTSLVYAIHNGRFDIPAKDVPMNSFTVSGMKAYVDNTDTKYEFRLTDKTDKDGHVFSDSNYETLPVTVIDGKAQFTVNYIGAAPLGFSANGFSFELQHRPEGSDDSKWETVPDYYETGPITGLMDGRYIFVEVQAPEGYERSYITENGIGAFEIKGQARQYRFTHKDKRKNANLDIYKVDEHGDPLDGAEFDLYYVPDKASKPTTYSISSPVTSPSPSPSVTIQGDPQTVPDPAEGTSTTTVTYSYKPQENVPTSEPKTWILPRTDNDYIFFEDVNCYSENKWFWKDGTFVNTTWPNSRTLTKGDLDNEPTTDIVAEFYDNSGKAIGKYKVWERFVYYNNSNGPVYENSTGRTQNIIWKIQPPDGAKMVRFILGWGTWHNYTDKFEFTKGKLYRRNGNGSSGHIEVATWDDLGANAATLPATTSYPRTAGNSGVAYEALPQKIIFRRNHEYCWDNIHIEFFKNNGTDANPSYEPIGERFPGYLMEPYAYAQSNYRIKFQNKVENDGDLCYEIAIPKEATHFRINNGTTSTHSSGDYENYGYYYSAITKIDLTSKDKKNYNNYWKFSSTNNRQNGTLVKWTDDEITLRNDTLYDKNGTAFEVNSDHDFVYFKKPAGWNNVYAYFYGGGDLRDDNWLRAVYSIWPGVLPIGSDLYSNGTIQDPTLAGAGSGNTFNQYMNSLELQPGATFKEKYGDTVYKFRRPLGDIKNYTKVIFSNGLVGAGIRKGSLGGKETKVIEYTLGYGYYANDGNAAQTSVSNWMQEENNKTVTYTFRKSGGTVDYLYIKNNAGNTWDDIHVQFYNGNTQILQQGHGYVMKYTGKIDGDNREWYKVPVPDNATHFSLSNGNRKQSSTYNYSKSTGKYPILAYSASTPTTSGYTTTGDMVYQIADTATSGTTYKLTLSSPTMERHEVTGQANAQVNDADYTTRGDKLNIVDMVNSWTLTNTPKIKFFDANGTLINTAANPNGEYHGIMSKNETSGTYNGKHWWSLDIPLEAASFTVNDGSSNPIFEKVDNNTGQTADFTTGGMYYKTTSNTAVEIIWPTFSNGTIYTGDNGTYDKRGDYLYMVCSSIGSDGWENMYVTFYSDASGSTAIANAQDIQMKYTGELTYSENAPVDGTSTNIKEAAGHWYKVAIPYEAKSFTVKTSDNSKQLDKVYPIYTKRSKAAVYRQNYTLGGMQYRISDTATDGAYTLGLATEYNDGQPFYPQFTENEIIEWEEGGSVPQEESTEPIVIDSSVTGQFKEAGIVSAPVSNASQPADTPVLYETPNDNITYTWDNYYNYLRFVPPSAWTGTINAYFFKEGDSGYTSWPGEKMTQIDNWIDGAGNSKPAYKIKIPDGDWDRVIFNNDGNDKNNQTVNIQFVRGSLYYVSGSVNGQSNTNKEVTPDSKYAETQAPTVIQDGKLRFNNSQNWSTVYAKFYNSSNQLLDADGNIAANNYPGTTMQQLSTDTTGTLSIGVPDNAVKVVITDGGSNTTGDIELNSENAFGRNKILNYGVVGTDTGWNTRNYIYLRRPVAGNGYSDATFTSWDATTIKLIKGSGDNKVEETGSMTSISASQMRITGTSSSLNGEVWRYAINPNDHWEKVEFWDSNHVGGFNGSGQNWNNGYTETKDLTNYGVGNYFVRNPDQKFNTGKNTLSDAVILEEYSSNSNYGWTFSNYSSASETYVSTYQPEDRYAMISDVNGSTNAAQGTGDINNFVRIISSDSDVLIPYIKFYSDTAGTNVIGGVDRGISVRFARINGTVAQLGKGTSDSPYLIRIPKNAKSVRLFDDNTQVGDLITLDNEGGVTLTVSSENSNINVTKTSNVKSSAYIRNYEQKTDFDYIYFTDTENWRSSSDSGALYAYYYGGADGEYNAWPGVPASSSYTDNSGKTVYVFQPPTAAGSRDKVYPYVIFNNGSASNRKLTQKIEYTMGYNYSPDSTNVPYGTVTNHAYLANGQEKATVGGSALPHSTDDVVFAGSQNYIFLVNNGTKNLSDTTDIQNRYWLDEVHIKFFDENGGAVGNVQGYRMDELMADYEGDTVYRILAPSTAKTFQITNGVGKGTGSYNYTRESVITGISENGLYRFVRKANEVYGDTPEQAYAKGNESDTKYYLELLNKRDDQDEEDKPIIITGHGEPIRLATVETGDDGHAKWITYLKRKDDSEDVDDNYLDHTVSDIRNESVKTVKVKKWGTYYWKETKAPVGFNADKEELETFVIDAQKADMSVYVFTAKDTHKRGSVVLTKTSEQKLGKKDIGTKLAGAEFELYKRNVNNGALNEKLYVLKHKITENLYYVPIAEVGKSNIVTDGDSKYLNVTDEDMKKALKDYELYDSDAGHFKLYDKAVTGEDGTLRIDNLDWGQYYLVETKAPTGYTVKDTTTGEANKIKFMVGRNTCETAQQLICTDEILPAQLKIKKELDEYLEAWGTPTFIFKIKKIATEESNTSFERIVSMQVNDSINMTGETGIINIEPGTYEITELNVSRYSPEELALTDESSGISGDATVTPNKRTITFTVEAGGKAVVKYDNTLDYYDKFSHTDYKLNTFNGYKSLIVEYNTPVPVTTDPAEINKSELKAWFVKSDGTKSESELTDEQKESLKIEYVKPEKDDTQSATVPQTKPKDELFDDKFKDDTDGKKIVINDPELFADGVYRLKATYGDASTGTISDTFDINMGSRSTGTYQFDTTVVFHASTDNLSYYYDEVPKVQAYTADESTEYTFDIPAENAVNGIISVRIPGLPKYNNFAQQYQYSVTDAYAEVTTVSAGGNTVDLLVTKDFTQHEHTLSFKVQRKADSGDLLVVEKPLKAIVVNGVTSEYVFNFTVVKDENDLPQIHSIRHNGLTVSLYDVKAIINNTNSDLKIIQTHLSKKEFENIWIDSENTEIKSTDLADAIAGNVKASDGKILVYTAKLKDK